MTKLAAQRPSRSLIPEWSDFFTGFPAFPSYPALAGLRPLFDSRLMRVEDETMTGRYEIRAELPGLDAGEDIDITVRDGQLTIKAQRDQKKVSTGRSEFLYGSFTRTIALPVGSVEDEITAGYAKGILTINVPVAGDDTERHVDVATTEDDVEVTAHQGE